MLTTIVVELVRGTSATGSLFQLVARNRRRYGGYIVHAAIVLLAIGIIGSGAYGTTKEVPLAVGQSMHVPGYTLTYAKLTNTPTVTETGTTVDDPRLPEGQRTLERHDEHRLRRTRSRSASRTTSASTRTGCAARTCT